MITYSTWRERVLLKVLGVWFKLTVLYRMKLDANLYLLVILV